MITNDLAALQNTVGDRGFVIEGNDVLEEDWQNRLFVLLEDIQNMETEKQQLIQKNYQWALEHTWSKRARIFSNLYLLPNLSIQNTTPITRLLQTEHLNEMTNKPDFIFNYKHKISIEKLLYIGINDGVRVIQLLKNNPYFRNTTVTVLENDISPQSNFYRNVFQEGFIRCFEISNQSLYHFIQQHKKYDCIILSDIHEIQQIQSIYLSYLLCQSQKYIVIYKNQNTLPHIQLFTQQLTNQIDIIEENEQLIVLQTK